MGRATASELVQAVVRAMAYSGAAAHLISSPTVNPRRFLVQHPTVEAEIWVYLWTLTPGGRPDLPHEYRVQLTSVESPLDQNPRGATLLLGYEPDRGMFAGFDIDRHREFTTGSPSVQIDVRSLDEARNSGLSFHQKSNEEIAIGIRPDSLLMYAVSSADLHRDGVDAAVRNLLVSAVTNQEIAEEELERLDSGRQKVVVTTSTWSRARDFRARVLKAYHETCAVSRSQMGLLDAAHILPVEAEGSTDGTDNGICLSPTLHRAFDAGLVYLDEDRVIRLNDGLASDLENRGVSGGLETIRTLCGETILLPESVGDRPSPEFIRKANELRGID